MKEQNNNFVHKLMLMYLTWFGAGRAKKAPGTFGTLAALPFIYAWSKLNTQLWVDLSVISALTFLACIIA
ncbi:MAG: phosphatidylglycerophosphatase A, partial [Bacteriovoracia bacterium]